MNRAELERIKASILPSTEDNNKNERKRALKEKSNERQKNWPNTLEALRIKKESYAKDKEAEEEARREEMDREVSWESVLLVLTILLDLYLFLCNFRKLKFDAKHV